MLERERELAVVERALDRLAGGAGSLLLIEAPAGIGKTRLLAEAVELARGRGLQVRAARGGELEREMPFGVARQLFQPLIERASERQRARLLSGSARFALAALGHDGPARAGREGDPLAPIDGLFWLLANVAESRPVLLSIDDAQWADAHTLRFLEYVSRRLADVPVLVAAGVRSGEPDQPVRLELLRLEAERIHPGALTSSAVHTLIASEFGVEPSPEFVEACATVTAGNPFLLAELLRGVRIDGMEPSSDAAGSVAKLAPDTVARYALVRLGRFGDDAISLAWAVAVLGGAPQLRHAARLAGVDEEQAEVLIDRLRGAEILAPGLPLDFVHPLVRQAIYGDLPEGQRSSLHRRAAEILASTGESSRTLAPHLLACSPNSDQWVVARLREAAAEATTTGAHESGVTYLERALAEPPESDLPVRSQLAHALMEAEPVRAPHVLEGVAVEVTDPASRLETLRLLAAAYFISGRLVDAERASAEALAIVDDRELG
ncbi:MAG: AAA family ATPase, partial [Actinobacteria bacterium]|nr:AAA family ATPase [Actinomycetota bacterium]